MDAPESGGIWTSAIALLGTSGAAATAIWKGLYNLRSRVTIVESATKDHEEKLTSGSKEIRDTHTAVKVLAETTVGLGKTIDKIEKGQEKILDFLLRGNGRTGG